MSIWRTSRWTSNLGLGVVLTAAILAWFGETSLFAQQPTSPPPPVRTSVPNIQARGATAERTRRLCAYLCSDSCGNICGHDQFWEFRGSAERDDDNSVERHDLLLLLPRGQRQGDDRHDSALHISRLHHGLEPRVYRTGADVLHARSSRLPVWSFPSAIRAADGRHDLHDRGDDTNVLLHKPRLFLCADDVLHGSVRDDARWHVCEILASGQRSGCSRVYAHDLQCPESKRASGYYASGYYARGEGPIRCDESIAGDSGAS